MRLTPLQALLHPFFEELYQPQMKTPENKCLPELFNFTKEE
jgi:glycogen synthase kinase 3 beta